VFLAMTSSVLKELWGLCYKPKHIQALDWIMTNQTELKTCNKSQPQTTAGKKLSISNTTIGLWQYSPFLALCKWSCGLKEVSLRCFPAFQHWTTRPLTFAVTITKICWHTSKNIWEFRNKYKSLYLIMAMALLYSF